MSDASKPAEQLSAAEIATRTEAVKAELVETRATTPATVKDEKWIQTRICELEDELRGLRDLEKSTAKPSDPVSAAPSEPVSKEQAWAWYGRH
jgi:hypothetical protein